MEGSSRAVVWLARPLLRPEELAHVSGAAVALTGYRPEELTGATPAVAFASLIHPDDRRRWDVFLGRAVAVGHADCSFRLRHARGRYQRCYELLLVDGLNTGNRTGVSCLVRCSRGRPDEKFKRSVRDLLTGYMAAGQPPPMSPTADAAVQHARLKYAALHAQEGGWDCDPRTGDVYLSPRWKEMFGFTDAELSNDLQTWAGLIAPEDFPRVQHELGACWSGEKARFEIEVRMRHKSGHWLQVLSRGVLVQDAQGELVRLVGSCLDVTARRKAEWALAGTDERVAEGVHEALKDFQSAVGTLRESEERFRLAMKVANQGFYDVNLESGAIVVSPEYARMLGHEPEAFVETIAVWLERMHPEDRAPVARVFNEYVAGRAAAFEVEFRQRMRGGGWKWIHSVGKIVACSREGRPLRLLGIHSDITEFKKVESELKRVNETLEQSIAQRTELLQASEQRFRMLSAASFEGVLISRDGVILDCNNQFAALLGSTRDGLCGQHVTRFLPPELHGRIMQGIQSGAESHIEHEVLCADGGRRLVETRGRSPDGPKGLRITVVRDLTARRRFEAESSAQRAQLLHFQRLAELSEVSAGIIHQIGQPLTAILNNVSAAKTIVTRCDNPRCAAADALIDSDACLKNVQLTIRRLKALAHPEQARREPRSLNAIVKHVTELLQKDFQSAGVSMHLALAPGLSPVSLDEVQFSQVLINLLRNACEAVVSCDPARRGVVVRTTLGQPGWQMIEVIDSGVGIKPENLGRITDPFFTTKPNGLGVGLSLCRTIIKAHSGRLQIHNNAAGHGAVARVMLPLTAESNATSAGEDER